MALMLLAVFGLSIFTTYCLWVYCRRRQRHKLRNRRHDNMEEWRSKPPTAAAATHVCQTSPSSRSTENDVATAGYHGSGKTAAATAEISVERDTTASTTKRAIQAGRRRQLRRHRPIASDTDTEANYKVAQICSCDQVTSGHTWSHEQV